MAGSSVSGSRAGVHETPGQIVLKDPEPFQVPLAVDLQPAVFPPQKVQHRRRRRLAPKDQPAFVLESLFMAAQVDQIVRKFGTKDSGKGHLRAFYEKVFAAIDAGESDAGIVELLTTDKSFTYLQPTESPYAGVSPTRYSAQVKSGLVMTGLLEHAPKCAICKGLVPSQAISVDHKKDRSEGGESDLANLQLTHPYCNTGYKTGMKHRERTVA